MQMVRNPRLLYPPIPQISEDGRGRNGVWLARREAPNAKQVAA
jgi:hypothetical protein